MDYFSKFLRSGTQPPPKATVDHAAELEKSWSVIKSTLLHPDERQLTRGIKSTDVPAHLKSIVDSLVWESTRTEEGGTGACLEYLLKNDVLGILVRLSENDRPYGIQVEVLRAVQNMVVLLDEQFLVHSAVHKAVLRLLRNCAGDDLQEQLDGRHKVMGAAGNAVRGQPSEYEEDLVNLLCILCSRIRTYRELLMIFFHDKHWYRSEPLFAVEEGDEEDEEEEEEEEERENENEVAEKNFVRTPSPTHSQTTVKSAPISSIAKKTEYEFLLFNYLLRFVHREGQIGDFARAGLLFLMDVAMSPGEAISVSEEEKKYTQPKSFDPVTDAALALAEYIVDGDFSEVLGAGLGAVYSLLPSKLEFSPQPASDRAQGMTIGITGLETEGEKMQLESARQMRRALGLEDASNPDFKSRLDHFLKLLEFLQDVLRRNVSNDSLESGLDASALVGNAIVQSILDAVRRIFLENILYPSILECSDTDGSAVAVMSYIDIMLRTLEPGALSNLLVDFLMSEDNDEAALQQKPHSMLNLNNGGPPQAKSSAQADKDAKLRRRKSSAMVLLEMEAPESRRQSHYFTSMGRFTLKDLLLANLRSDSQPTATAALQLLQSMLTQHSEICMERLLIIIPDSVATSFPAPAMTRSPTQPKLPDSLEDDDEIFLYPDADPRPHAPVASPAFLQPEITFSTHEREMGLYLALVSRVDPSHSGDAFSTGYDHYLRDALLAIQSQPSFQLDSDAESRARLKHRLNANDPILSLVLASLRKFFCNTPEFNVALTGLLVTLATNPDRSLAGWLTFGTHDAPPLNETDEYILASTEDGDDRSIDFRIEERLGNDSNALPASSMDEQSRPVVHSIFHGLVAQLERYRQMVEDFDKYLLERRRGLLFSENLIDALTLGLEFQDEISTPPTQDSSIGRPKSKPKASSSSSSFVSFLTPKKAKPVKSNAPTEPSTPQRGDKKIAASPFGSHYQRTGAIVVEPFVAPVPASGPSTSGKSSYWREEEDVFSSSWADRDTINSGAGKRTTGEDRSEQMFTVTLSQLLDNVVILEESIKELAAIIHARRSLGIDSIRYL